MDDLLENLHYVLTPPNSRVESSRIITVLIISSVVDRHFFLANSINWLGIVCGTAQLWVCTLQYQ